MYWVVNYYFNVEVFIVFGFFFLYCVEVFWNEFYGGGFFVMYYYFVEGYVDKVVVIFCYDYC